MIPPEPREPVELGLRHLRLVFAPTPDSPIPRVVVGMAVRVTDLAHSSDALTSVALAEAPPGGLGLVLVVDTLTSTPWSVPDLPEVLNGRTWIYAGNFGSAARARNAVLEIVEHRMPGVRWVARLDADDRLTDPWALARTVACGDEAGSHFIIAGNRVIDRFGQLMRLNWAGPDLLTSEGLLERTRGMADGTSLNELPSCNLVLDPRLGWRYPEFRSAEDHWLVAGLAWHRRGEGVVACGVLLTDYTVDGRSTLEARQDEAYRQARIGLAEAVEVWAHCASLPGQLLGWGNEGVVRLDDGHVHKHFYKGKISDEQISWWADASRRGIDCLPVASFSRDSSGRVVATYPWEPTSPADRISEEQAFGLLSSMLRFSIVCANIKRANFRIREDGRLFYIDIGNWVIPMEVSYFQDAAARLYSISVLGHSDDELLRRTCDLGQPVVWDALPGFGEFYRSLILNHAQVQWAEASLSPLPTRHRRPDVTLLIKACAMDCEYLDEQVCHIVDQLVGPGDFYERILLVDAFRGPFVRQHHHGDINAVMTIATSLKSRGVVDRVLVVDLDPDDVKALNRRWFDIESSATRTSLGVPVAPHLWGFEQVCTRYLLQADADVLIGRRDPMHDVVREMVDACGASDVLGVAFNIPWSTWTPARPYAAASGDFVPEVRLGMLDLEAVFALRPLPNMLNEEGGPMLTWYRSLQQRQQLGGERTLRGGSPATFYLHPMNDRKSSIQALREVRHLVEQGKVPASQHGRWDLEAPQAEWRLPARSEAVVIYASGRNTQVEALERFCKGLAMQRDQRFGVIVVDDASTRSSWRSLADRLHFLGDRLTLVRNVLHQGRLPNLVHAVRELCGVPETLIAIVDLDDALMDRDATGLLRAAAQEGHDLVLGGVFRPDTPSRLYKRSFSDILRTYGGNVWMHLRAFRKSLFEEISAERYKRSSGDWFPMCTDYATMVPMALRARRPIYLPRFLYWHERTTAYDAATARLRDELIMEILRRSECDAISFPSATLEGGWDGDAK